MSEVYFPAESGGRYRLKEMILPESLRLHPIDQLYGKSGQAVLGLPAEVLNPATPKAATVKSHDGRRKKLKEEWRQFLIQCGIRNGPEFLLDHKEYQGLYFEEKNQYYFSLWQNDTKANFTRSRAVELITVELDNGTKNLFKDTQVDRGLLSEVLYKEWNRKFLKKSQNVNGLNYWNEFLEPAAGYFVVRYVYKRRLFSWVKEPRWGGIDKELIPINTTRGDVVDANVALRAPLAKQSRLKVAAKYLPLVLEDENNEAGYSTAFLDSLDIRRPKIVDVNLLWGEIQEKDFQNVLNVAIELLEIGISGAGLEIYDKESGSLRPATDFRLGRKETKGLPLIERQYGKPGRTLGEILGLPEGNEVSSFLGFFENIISTYPSGVGNISSELYRLLKYWQDWDTRSRGIIAADLQATLDKHNITSPPVAVFNNPKFLSSLKKAGILALGLKIDNGERYALERSARELGLILPEDAGDLKVTGEEPLDKQELLRLDRLLYEYVNSLEEHEKSRLAAQAAGWGLGNYEMWGKRVLRARSLERVVGPAGEAIFPLVLPYLDSHRRLFFVEPSGIPEFILAHLLSMCGFTRFKHAYTDIKEIARRIKDAAPSSEQADNSLSRRGKPGVAAGHAVNDADTEIRDVVGPAPATEKDGSGMISADAGSCAIRATDSYVRGAGDTVNTVSAGDCISGAAGIVPGDDSNGGVNPASADAGNESADAGNNIQGTGGVSVYDVARAVREGLLDKRTLSAAGYGDKGWNSGLDPEQEDELRKRIGARLIESFSEGPEFYERKLRVGSGRSARFGVGENLKVVDSDTSDPKMFLLAEYGGRCQVCATELSLCSGRKWFEVFRICEPRGIAWWDGA